MKRFVHNLNSSFELQNVEKVLKRKEANKENRNIKQRISVGLLFFLLICYDLYTKAICRWFSLSISLVWFAESILLTASAVYTIAESIAYVSSVLFPKYVDVTDREKTLLGIGDNEPGFRKSPTTTAQSTPVRNIKFSPSSYNQSAHLSPGHTSSSGVMTVRAGASLHLDDSHHSFASYTGSLTPSFYAKTPVGSFNGQLNSSADDSFPRLRLSPSRYLSPERTTSGMTSQKDLDSFLEKEAIKENKELLRQAEMNTANVSSFWNVNRRVLDYIPMLKNFKYQVAPRSSQQSSASSGSDSDHRSKYPADELWSKLGASQSDVDLWIENLRYWLAQTVMQRVAKEIHNINRELRNIGSDETQIGEASVSALKNVAFVKNSFVPTLNNVIPYLEVSSNQDYLIKRISDLGNDGCLADFNWDGGCAHKGKPWEDHLPTDSAIVMHLLCTYLDSRFPANPKYPDGKAFSAQHFMAPQAKPNFDQHSDYLTIYQTKVNPPHYKVVIGNDIYDLPKGRNNLFHAILLFLHEIKTKHNGMLGNVAFGTSGINILWIMTHKYR